MVGPERGRDDAGGVWIVTGWVVGLIFYAGIVLAWHAGFTAAAPFVVIPAVLVVMIAAGNLVSGRRQGRPAPRFNRPDLDPVPLSTFRPDRPPAPDDGAGGAPAGDPAGP
jgi:hypothetical protein